MNLIVTEAVQLADVVLDPSNARSHPRENIEAIKGSLARFGQQKPVIVDDHLIVRAGNGTVLAARELGWKSIVVTRTALTGAELTAFAIADNRSAELAEWDDAALAVQLDALSFEGVPLEAMGFCAEDLKAAVDALSEDVDGERLDEVEKAAKEIDPKLQAVIDARHKSDARGDDKGDCSFWACLVFQSHEQKLEFLEHFKSVPVVYDTYLDGQAFAEAVSAPVTPNAQKPYRSTVEKKLADLVAVELI